VSVRSFPLLVLVIGLGGCLNVGPNTIVQDRFKYHQAIRDSWEEQMLSNMVAIRYGESPVFFNVDSVIAQYELRTSGMLTGSINTGFGGAETLEGSAAAGWSERPTITYAPVEGQEFAVSLLTPIRPSELFALIEAGWDAERSFRLLLKSINGLRAYDPSQGKPNPDFFRVLDAFRVLQQERALGIRREETDQGTKTFVYLRDVAANEAIEGALELLVDKLRLRRDRGEGVEVVFGPYFRDGNTLAVQTMSVMDILTESSAYVQAPEQHVEQGRTTANRTSTTSDAYSRPLLNIRSSQEKPADALVAVRSRGYWFYIDDRDIESKKAFSFLMIVMQVSAAHQGSKGPVVTVGAGS